MTLAPSMSSASTAILNFLQMKKMNHTVSSSSSVKERSLQSLHCTPLEQIELQVEPQSMCEPCGGIGWLLCDFCKGQKTNVKSANNRIYRRCPSCKAIGCTLCSKCKVFKCVTFPNVSDVTI